jgi:hypothetical protein
VHNPAFGRWTSVLAKEFFDLVAVPLAIKWFANITNPETHRAYQNDLKDDQDRTELQDHGMAVVYAKG